MIKKNYLKIGSASFLVGLAMVFYSKIGSFASASFVDIVNGGELTVMKYIFGIGMGLIVLAIVMFAFLTTGKTDKF